MTNEIEEKISAISPPGWRHRINVGQGIVTPGREDSSLEMERLQVETDLTEKRVLDIGCSDGYFSFACEQRGATVIAIDNFISTPNQDGQNGFTIAAGLLGSSANLIEMSVYDIDSIEGEFDVILFINVF